MGPGPFRRRGVLGGIAATVLGFAGQRDDRHSQSSRSDALLQQGDSQSVARHTHSGPQQGGSTVIAEELIHSARETNTHASDRRPILSTEPKEVFVDPDSGDDANNGSQDAPLQSLQEALDRVPLVVQHDHHINLADGTYDGGKPVSAPMHFAGGSHQSHPMRIQGNPDDPSQVVIDNNVMLSTHSNEMDNALLRDVTITGSLQNIDSHFQVQNIRFTGTNDEVILGGAAFKTHDPSITMLRDCSFTQAYDFAADVALGARLMLDNCSGSVSNYGINAIKGATVTEIGSNDLSGANGYINLENGARYVPRNGPVQTTQNG